jgi:hypothetical protein
MAKSAPISHSRCFLFYLIHYYLSRIWKPGSLCAPFIALNAKMPSSGKASHSPPPSSCLTWSACLRACLSLAKFRPQWSFVVLIANDSSTRFKGSKVRQTASVSVITRILDHDLDCWGLLILPTRRSSQVMGSQWSSSSRKRQRVSVERNNNRNRDSEEPHIT